MMLLFQECDIVHENENIVRQRSWWRRQDGERLSVDIHCCAVHTHTSITLSLIHYLPIRYDTIDDLHWKTDRQAAGLI